MDNKKEWRKSEPSDKQLNFIKMLGSSEVPKTAGEASDLINRLMLVKKIEKIRTFLVKNNIVKQDIIDKLTKETDDWFHASVIKYCAIADNCLKLGIEEPAQIGMFFNNCFADKRNS